jgi:mannose-6-phosphate isomerase-like protein (cupin superfamily)
MVEAATPVVRVGSEGERYNFGGFDIVFKSPAPGAEEAWTAADYTLPAKQNGAPPHYHKKLIESFYVLSGELWMKVGDREVNAGPGSFVLVPPGVVHSFANRTEQPARFLAHASSPDHKAFLCELIRMATTEGQWPPKDPSQMIAMAERYDTYYL